MTTEQSVPDAEPVGVGADAYERRWMGIAAVILMAFAVTVTVAGFALGFQVPGDESRVDPRTIADAPPWSEPGLRDRGNGEFDAYIIAKQYVFDPRTITVPPGSTVNFFITSTDVQHGFKLQDTNINMQIVPGQVSRLSYTFDEIGEHLYICHEFCGIGHAAMFGSVVVVDEEAEGQ